MFSKSHFLLISLFFVFVSACTTITTHPPTPSPVNCQDCLGIGFTPYCCEKVYTTSSPEGSGILTLLNICIEPEGIIGVSCIPGCRDMCAGNMLCCEGNLSSGLAAYGCVNIII